MRPNASPLRATWKEIGLFERTIDIRMQVVMLVVVIWHAEGSFINRLESMNVSRALTIDEGGVRCKVD